MAKAKTKNRPKKKKPAASKEQLEQFYRDMLLIRRFEEKAGQLYGLGLIGGFCHLYIGQEAVVVGCQSVVREQDTVVTAYRDHGHMLACGMDPNGVMAELTGRRDGYSKGKGGSMHMFSREKKFFGGHGIVGAQVPIGTGLALSHKYQETGGVSWTYFGDGAANQGQVHEAYNMAALWDLPVVYIIENNKYGMGTSVERASASKDFYHRGEPFGIPGERVDGMDILAVREAAQRALKHVESKKTPYILEIITYRYRGHSMSDPAKYRSKDEVNKIRSEQDPIDKLREYIIDNKVMKEDEIKEIDKEIKERVNKAAEFAQESEEPELSELYTDILLEPSEEAPVGTE